MISYGVIHLLASTTENYTAGCLDIAGRSVGCRRADCRLGAGGRPTILGAGLVLPAGDIFGRNNWIGVDPTYRGIQFLSGRVCRAAASAAAGRRSTVGIGNTPDVAIARIDVAANILHVEVAGVLHIAYGGSLGAGCKRPLAALF